MVEGSISSFSDVSIGESGVFSGFIKAKHLVICGKVEAQIYCDSLDILKTGELHGEVICREFVLEEGAQFTGQRYELNELGNVVVESDSIEAVRHQQLLVFAGLTTENVELEAEK